MVPLQKGTPAKARQTARQAAPLAASGRRAASGVVQAVSGQWLDIDINRRIVGISLEALSKIDTVIGVAGGSRKGAAILGALRGRYINVLITDDQAAQKVLALN